MATALGTLSQPLPDGIFETLIGETEIEQKLHEETAETEAEQKKAAAWPTEAEWNASSPPQVKDRERLERIVKELETEVTIDGETARQGFPVAFSRVSDFQSVPFQFMFRSTSKPCFGAWPAKKAAETRAGLPLRLLGGGGRQAECVRARLRGCHRGPEASSSL